jgi:hypothetical protein
MKAAAERPLALLVLLTLPALAANAAPPPAAPPPAAPSPAHPGDGEADEDLLEFLGSVGGEDAEFTDYLSRTDIAQAAKTPPPKPAPAPPPPEVKKS